MSDVLIYWRDYAANWAYQFVGERAFSRHSRAKRVGELLPSMKMLTRSMDGEHKETGGCVQPPGANFWSLSCSARCLSIEGIIQLLG